MNLEQLALGEASALLRSVARCPDPIEAFVACCGGSGKLGTALLETAETPDVSGAAGKSLIVARSALRLACRSGEVEVEALDRNGASLLPWLAARLDGAERVTRDGSRLRCAYRPVHAGSEEQRLKAPSPVDVLRRLLFGLVDRVDQPSAAPLLVGTFAYDLLETFEPLPGGQDDPLGWPDYEFFLPDRFVWLDHQRGCATICAHLFGGEHVASAYGAAMSAIIELVEAIEGADRERPARPPSARSRASTVEVDVDDEAFAALVGQLKEHIVAGDVFQIVPSRTFSLPIDDPLAAYRELRASNPSPYMFYLNGASGVLFGTSPETAVEVEGQPRHVHIRPIAGTRRRGRREDGTIDHDLDSRLEAELRLSEKEVAEHMMLVDLARNDVARVSEPGTRRVDGLLQVCRYSHVMHLYSHVTGTLRADLDALHGYVATMNMGTLVGAPKVRAAQLLRQYERRRRGPYGGAVGYLTADGRMDTGIVIRAAVVKDGRAYVRAGAGVVYDSEPLAEADETRRKAQVVLDAVRREGSAR